MDPLSPYSPLGMGMGGFGMSSLGSFSSLSMGYSSIGLPQLLALGATYLFGTKGEVSNSYLFEALKWYILGYLVDLARRAWVWAQGAMKVKYSMTATFSSPDPAYEWIMLFLVSSFFFFWG